MLIDTLGAQITKSLTASSISTMQKSIVSYVDKNSEILLTLDLSKRYSFGDSDRAVVYTAIGVTEDEMIQAVKASKYISKSNKIQSNPFYIATMLTMNFLLKQKKEKEAMQVMTYMQLMMYTSAHKGFFEYGANKQIMDYTIAHLGNSFIIRNMSSLFAFLEDNMKSTYSAYKDRIIRGDDKDFTYVIDAFWTRLKGKLKKIANEYYKNHENGNYLNADTDSQNPDDYHEMDNNSFAVDRLANKVYVRLLNHQYDDRFIKYGITRSDVSYPKLKNLIDDIVSDDENNTVKDFIVSMIEYYLIMSGNGFEYISKGEFISFMKAAYSSNSEVQQLVMMKSTLDQWMNDHMVVIGRQNYGKTAKISYKRGIYMFFVFLVNYEAKVR